MDKFECSGRCYECAGCEDLELQIYTELLFKAMGLDCETTQEKIEKSLCEAERLTKVLLDKNLTEYEKIPIRAKRLACNLQTTKLLNALSDIEYKCRKFKEIVGDGADKPTSK